MVCILYSWVLGVGVLGGGVYCLRGEGEVVYIDGNE